MSSIKYGSIPEETKGAMLDSASSKSNYRTRPSLIVVGLSLCLVVIFILSSGTVASRRSKDRKSHIPMMGRSHHSSSFFSAKDRLLDDCGYIDVPNVSCELAFNTPFFRNYIEFQHTVAGVDIISLVGGYDDDKSHVYELEFAGMNVSLYVSYEEDAPLTADIELVDGFDFFDAYHEHWAFQDLPTGAIDNTDANCRNVGDKKQHGKHHHHHLDRRFLKVNNGCRIVHSFIAIFSKRAPVTRNEWYAAVDAEAIALYDLLTSK